jgi:hypothetical protein
MWIRSTLLGSSNLEPHDFPHANEQHLRYLRHPRNRLTLLYLTLKYLAALLHRLKVALRLTPTSLWRYRQHFHLHSPLLRTSAPIREPLDDQLLRPLVLYRLDVHRTVSRLPFLLLIPSILLTPAGC